MDCLGLWKARQVPELGFDFHKLQQNVTISKPKGHKIHGQLKKARLKCMKEVISKIRSHIYIYNIYVYMARLRISNYRNLDCPSLTPPPQVCRSTNQPILRRARTQACHCPNGSMPRQMWDRGSSPSVEVFINKVNKTSSCEG